MVPCIIMNERIKSHAWNNDETYDQGLWLIQLIQSQERKQKLKYIHFKVKIPISNRSRKMAGGGRNEGIQYIELAVPVMKESSEMSDLKTETT